MCLFNIIQIIGQIDGKNAQIRQIDGVLWINAYLLHKAGAFEQV